MIALNNAHVNTYMLCALPNNRTLTYTYKHR